MWFFYSLYFAIWSAYSTFFVKRNTQKINYLPLMFILMAGGIPFLFTLVLLSGGIPQVTPTFYLLMLFSGMLDTIAFFSFFSAISKSEISEVAPIASFGPIFTTILAIFTLSETPELNGFIGILLIVLGAYVLNISDIKQGLLQPFKTLFSRSGTWLFLLATLLWAVTPIFQKRAILETTPQVPLYASFWGILFVTFLTGIFSFRKALKETKFIKENIKQIIIFESGSSLAQLAAYTAFTLIYVGYATAVFRTSALFVVLFGGLFLKEKRFKERLIGVVIMIGGVILLVL